MWISSKLCSNSVSILPILTISVNNNSGPFVNNNIVSAKCQNLVSINRFDFNSTKCYLHKTEHDIHMQITLSFLSSRAIVVSRQLRCHINFRFVLIQQRKTVRLHTERTESSRLSLRKYTTYYNVVLYLSSSSFVFEAYCGKLYARIQIQLLCYARTLFFLRTPCCCWNWRNPFLVLSLLCRFDSGLERMLLLWN